jgi:hypothetical protein
MKSFGSIAVSVATLMFANSAVAEDAPTAQTIVKAWQERANKIESLDVSWWSKRTDAADPHPPVSMMDDQRAIRPVPELVAIWRYRFLMDGKNRFLFEVLGHDWIPEKGEFIPSHIVEEWDGKSLKVFYDSGRFTHHVTIQDFPLILPKRNWELHTRPIEMGFGPTHMGFELIPETSHLVLAKETETIENSQVLIIGNEDYTFRVDPKKDFLPLRCTASSGALEIQISYQPNDVVGWVPKSWMQKTDRFSESGTVTQCTINQPIDDSQFKFDLRGGVSLQNNNTKPITTSIIYPDGKQRELKRSEWNKPFEELLKDEHDAE